MIVKEVFETSVGTVEVRVDNDSRTIAVYRFDDQRRVVAAAIENWDYVELVDVFSRQAGVPLPEANGIADAVRAQLAAAPPPAPVPDWKEYGRASRRGSIRIAGLPRRYVAVVIDIVVVLFPLELVMGLLSGDGYFQRGDGYVRFGIDISNKATLLALLVGLTYYVFGEGLTGATLGKRVVKIRVVGEDGEHPTLGAAVVRNILRLVDGLFFYLVGAVYALSSPRRQRLGDRVAHTLVVRS